MDTKNVLIAVGVLLVGGVAGYGLAGLYNNTPHMMNDGLMDESMPGMHMMPDGTMMENGDMMGMDHMNMMVESEREFLAGMIPHHQEAVDTATEVLERGGSTPEIKALAENIIVAQEAEIAQMKAWYLEWYGTEYQSDGSYMPMMRELAELAGAELDQRFLEDMVMHHMGAIMMARSVDPYIEHQEIADLTTTIIETQTQEIALMQDLLSGLE